MRFVLPTGRLQKLWELFEWILIIKSCHYIRILLHKRIEAPKVWSQKLSVNEDTEEENTELSTPWRVFARLHSILELHSFSLGLDSFCILTAWLCIYRGSFQNTRTAPCVVFLVCVYVPPGLPAFFLCGLGLNKPSFVNILKLNIFFTQERYWSYTSHPNPLQIVTNHHPAR